MDVLMQRENEKRNMMRTMYEKENKEKENNEAVCTKLGRMYNENGLVLQETKDKEMGWI